MITAVAGPMHRPREPPSRSIPRADEHGRAVAVKDGQDHARQRHADQPGRDQAAVPDPADQPAGDGLIAASPNPAGRMSAPVASGERSCT